MQKKSRREILKTLGLSSGAVWMTPIISSIALPAHAHTSCFTYAICDTGPGGGIVFFIENDEAEGCHGLEAAPVDQSTGVGWGCSGTNIATSTGIEQLVSTNGAVGSNNTDLILAGCPSPANVSAAAVARNYVGPNGDTDWFLPSRDELDLMYDRLHGPSRLCNGGFTAVASYWSSSQSNSNNAWFQNFNSGDQFDFANKANPARARVVRTF